MSTTTLAIILSILVLIAVHAMPWMQRNSATLVRNPSKLASVLSFLHVVPHLVIVSIWPEESSIFPRYGARLLDLIPQFAMYYAMGLCFLYLGIGMMTRKATLRKKFDLNIRINYTAVSIFMLSLYLASLFMMILYSGGVSAYIGSFGSQTTNLSGSGFFSIIKTPALYLSVLFLVIQHARTGRPGMGWILALIALVVLLEAGLGGRRAPIQVILFSVVAIQMANPKKNILSFYNITLAVACIGIFFALLTIRDSASGYVGQRSFLSYLVNFSYNDIYMFTLDHFSKYEKWYGKVFLDFQYRFFGWSEFSAAPSLDEGIYIYNLYLGRAAEPPTSPDFLAANSWPPRTFGNGFANFGLLGILGFFWLQGIVTGLAYSLAERSRFQPILVFLFLMCLFSFQISNLKITEMLIVLTGLGLMFGPVWILQQAAISNAGLTDRRPRRWDGPRV